MTLSNGCIRQKQRMEHNIYSELKYSTYKGYSKGRKKIVNKSFISLDIDLEPWPNVQKLWLHFNFNRA